MFGRKVMPDGKVDEITILRAGIFDDEVLNEWKPEGELFTDRRLEWVNPLEGVEQYNGMLPLP